MNIYILTQLHHSWLAQEGRTLVSIYSKFSKLRGLGYKTYTKMYEVGVTPILEYFSGVWGYTNYGKIDTIQNRAIRFYL